MPYLGQRPSKGDENNFKILDNISSYTLTFDGSDATVVSAANDTITSLTHRFVQGQRVTYNKGGGTVIPGLSDGVYYIIKNDHNTIKLATSASNASNGVAVNITGVGGGSSHTLNVAFDGVNTKFKATHTNGQKAKITRSAQLVISINGVIQQPHDSATPSTGFGFDLDGTIVFSQAPVSTDAYWAHVLTNNNVTFDISDNDIDNFTGNGSTVSFNLSKSPPDNRNILVTLDGVVQYPNDPDGTVRAYTVVENVLTFTTAPASGVEIQVRHIGFAGSTSGGGSGGVTSFYGRTGAVVLKSTDNITVNDAAITGNATVTGDLTVNGTTTTLDTVLTEVDKLEVAANNSTVGAAITQSGTGDILNLYDGSSEVFTVTDGGDVGIARSIFHLGDTNTDIGFPYNDAIIAKTGGVQTVLLNSSGALIEGRIKQNNTNNTVLPTGDNYGAYAYTPYPHELELDNNQRGTQGSFAGMYFVAGADSDGSKVGTARISAVETGNYKADLVFSTRNSSFTEKVRIKADGKVGIGSAIPENKLKINVTSGNDGMVVQNTSSANIAFIGVRNGDATLQIGQYGSTASGNVFGIAAANLAFMYTTSYASTHPSALLIGNSSNKDIIFATNATENLRIKSDGKIGIGTVSPDQNLELFKESGTNLVKVSTEANSTVGFEIEKTGSTTQTWRIVDGQTVNGALEFYDVTDDETRLMIDTAGRILINRTAQHASSSERLSVNGMTSIQYNSTTTAGLYIFNEETTTSGNPIQPFIFCSDGSGLRAGLGVQRSTGVTVLNGQFGLSFRTGSSGVGGSERLRLGTNGEILTAGVTSEPLYPHYVTARKVQMEIKGAIDTGQTRHHGSLAVNCTNSNSSIHLVRSDNTQTDGTHIGVLGWVGYDGADFHQAAAIEVIKGAGAGSDDQPGHMLFKTNAGTNQATERLRIDSSGRVLIGSTSNNTSTKVGDSPLQVYSQDRKHPAIRIAAGNSNGLTMLSDAYKSDESQINFGISYSSAKLVLSTSVKPSDTADNVYLSSQDTFAARPCALTMNHQGVLAFLNTSTNATTTTDSAVTLTERFRIDSSGHILPGSNDTYNLGSNSLRWSNVFTTDLQLSNKGKVNDVDGTWGDYTIQEGESDLFLINNRNGKKYQFMLKEVS